MSRSAVITKSRPMKIACANLSTFERQCLVSLLPQGEGPRRIEEIGGMSYAFSKHAHEVFDIIFLSTKGNQGSVTELVRSLRTVSDETLLVLLVREGDESVAAIVACDVGVDAIMTYNESRAPIQETVSKLFMTAERSSGRIQAL